MKRTIIALICVATTLSICAQPAKSRVATTAAKTNSRTGNANAQNVSRASIMFPTAVDVPEDVSWRRDIYRELDLKKDENAALYYPVEPQEGRVNLFTLLFQLLNTGKIPAYNYETSGVENFTTANRMHFKDMLDRYNIYYEVEGNSIKVASSDIPSNQVLSYFVKESSYYDQNTSTYHSRVVALCPVLHESDEFMFGSEGAAIKKPMFWVKISDIEGYLSQNMLMISNVNNAAQMSMADFFATNQYKGQIYMTTNMQGKTLAEMARDEAEQLEQEKQPLERQDSLLILQQNRIEKQMSDFEQHIWTTPVDSAELQRRDSIATAEAANKKVKKTTTSRTAARSSSKTEKAEKSSDKKSSSSSSSGSAAPRVSVRRERH